MNNTTANTIALSIFVLASITVPTIAKASPCKGMELPACESHKFCKVQKGWKAGDTKRSSKGVYKSTRKSYCRVDTKALNIALKGNIAALFAK